MPLLWIPRDLRSQSRFRLSSRNARCNPSRLSPCQGKLYRLPCRRPSSLHRLRRQPIGPLLLSHQLSRQRPRILHHPSVSRLLSHTNPLGSLITPNLSPQNQLLHTSRSTRILSPMHSSSRQSSNRRALTHRHYSRAFNPKCQFDRPYLRLWHKTQIWYLPFLLP